MIWIIGAGPMAIDYFKVVDALKKDTTVIGRSQKSADKFKEITGKNVITGGLKEYLDTKPTLPESAIVSASVEQLATTAIMLMNYGVKKILLEKPGGISSKEIQSVADTAQATNSKILVAYNRRYYASILKAKEMIEADGGVTSFSFEITEWSHVIKNHNKDVKTMHSWFLGNTSHVVDAAFFLCGMPTEISTFKNGTLDWHPASSNFAGAGATDKGALFSYSGNWEGPGRWTLDVITPVRRYIFCPFEQLHSQEIGTIAVNKVEIADDVEKELKPGLYLQCKDFFESNYTSMCSIEEQIKLSRIYEDMAGYS
jgi:predicted dehydrogenase